MEEAVFRVLAYTSIIASMSIALYGVIARTHSLSKIIAFSMFTDIVCIFIVFLGYRIIDKSPLPPIFAITGEISPNEVTSRAVDPLTQCLVLTALVIGLASLILMTFLTLESSYEEGGES
ncbi:MAG: NADH-quinone oxidoreductase subunit K [Acidilobaceae archaeon]